LHHVNSMTISVTGRACRSQPDRLTQKCFDEVFQAEQASADDIRTDPLLYNACQACLTSMLELLRWTT